MKSVDRTFRRTARTALATPLARFLLVGVASTLAYALLFLALAAPLGSSLASATALAITAVANTAANRRLTFGVRGRENRLRQQAAGLVVFTLTLALTTGSLDLLHRLDRHASSTVELSALLAGTLAATVTRYAALRSWVFRRPSGA